MELTLILLTNAVFAIALILTGALRRYALHVELIDQAGHRSAHHTPTPRGGGASIVLSTLLATAASPWLLGVSSDLVFGLVGGGIAVAMVGWLDDHGHVPPLVRLAAHFAAAIWLIWWIGPLPLDLIVFWQADWIVGAGLVSVLFVVWMVNLYNFMDGIDGLAAGLTLVVVLGGVVVASGTGLGSLPVIAIPLVLAAATMGFLPWNWPPARIFMGDVSSGFLGFMLAALVLAMGTVAPRLAYAWAILPGVFIADATVTLIRRLLRREKVYEAHRSHAYQRWTRRVGGHLPITVSALAITWLWLFPLAYLIATETIGETAGVVTAMLPLFVGALLLGAGDRGA
ncbi:MraY family glycosyltransferase [Sphingomonas sp.]|uniref:MraY family glycosyltransferase n=1 Tax=Sphingomonas sp. TaxID=28214 RepID=UPI002DD6B53D|nr:glycosyltransferase family 4 protein [Sphingomonas sp.]